MPKARSVGEWLTAVRSRAPIPDLIEDLIPNGNELTLIAGRPGSGKTNLALYLALCLATGTPFFGFATKQIEVTYLGFEGAETKLANRLEKIMRNFPNPGNNFHFEIIRPTKIGDDFVALVKGSPLVIIDPLRYLIEQDFCRPQDVSDFLSKLRTIAIVKSLCFVLVHHIRKPQAQIRIEPDDLYQIKGATEFVDAATTVLLLERAKHKPGPKSKIATLEPPEATHKLYFAKARDAIGDIQPLDLHFNPDKLLFEMKKE